MVRLLVSIGSSGPVPITIRTGREKGGRHVKRIVVLFCIGALLAACGGRPASEPDAAVPLVSHSGRIVFTSDRDDDAEIYVMNADGSGLTRLTNDPAWDDSAVWSPDGSRIAFRSDRDGNEELYVMTAPEHGGVTHETAPLRLTHTPANERWPSWSPDGKHLAFRSDRDGNAEIYVMNADGSGQTRLTDDPAADELPAWSPDGGRIAFVSDRDGNAEIYVMNVDGSDPINLTKHPASDSWPAWSPDGSRILFASDRDGDTEIYVMAAPAPQTGTAAGSGAATRLTDNERGDWSPTWSPDGFLIAFSVSIGDDKEIHLMNADGTGQTRLSEKWTDNWLPAWSP